ncbi:MAG TPA: hypothetical protein VJU59_11845 [Paraburkholderia sp.]|uniref:hypothetical protein n=1 Tax=Paraburkholderia sp. TaxID=1926495 RepID=UPI002B45B407|nr:hypothetical protein [Paraburkholderia sp.]HKR40350.1 hypothetical protein [Paraburkholderia sp.]
MVISFVVTGRHWQATPRETTAWNRFGESRRSIFVLKHNIQIGYRHVANDNFNEHGLDHSLHHVLSTVFTHKSVDNIRMHPYINFYDRPYSVPSGRA